MGIEPTLSAWKAEVLPLNYTRNRTQCLATFMLAYACPQSLFQWWRGKDSNLRRLSRQIYSLIPLTAREPLQKIKQRILLQSNPYVNTRYSYFPPKSSELSA